VSVPNFDEDPHDLGGHRGMVQPVMDAGDVLLFMGGAVSALTARHERHQHRCACMHPSIHANMYVSAQ
jgi:hypothetical protein